MLRTPILAATLLLAACGARPQPHRFGSPMLGNASVPPAALSSRDRSSEPPPPEVRAEPIRAATAPAIREVSLAGLPTPHRADPGAPAAIHVPEDLRRLVGQRDARAPVLAALGWARDLGMQIDPRIATGPDLVAWADETHRLHEATLTPERGDLLVFDRVNSDDASDLLGIVIARDERGVAEFLYLGGGVVRRGFVDATRPATKRDKRRAIVNTFLRTGRRWPLAGSHYLAAEHLAQVIR